MSEFVHAFLGKPDLNQIEICLDAESREILLELVNQFRSTLLGDADQSLERLYPPAYPEDPKLNAEYDDLVHDDLLREKLESIDVLESTIWLEFVELEAFFAWMSIINSVRLVLGTRLNVSEEDEFDFEQIDDPEQTLFVWLAMLLDEAVTASTFYLENFNKT
ncbi:MAG TPA: DUF2017 family protein [Acidimicrobiales bacterium]|nr:DUF2017 family protein [Acidimicrobiales bacterium]|tara:strand:- start:2249 stop:2737 length:489 start_codon:yes stop_codon:yes gene_type:complete